MPEDALKWKCSGTRDMLVVLLRRVADELPSYMTDDRNTGSDRPTIILRFGPERIVLGTITIEELPGNRCLLRVPPNRGASAEARAKDPEGRLLQTYLDAAISELRSLGFLASSSRFESHSVLDTARRELDSASEPEAFAAVGNVLRSAIIALGDELYKPHMLPSGESEPKGDDARQKLKFALRHYFAGRAERYREGIEGVVDACWGIVSPVPHRKSATRDELEAALAIVGGLFDAFSFIVPEGR